MCCAAVSALFSSAVSEAVCSFHVGKVGLRTTFTGSGYVLLLCLFLTDSHLLIQYVQNQGYDLFTLLSVCSVSNRRRSAVVLTGCKLQGQSDALLTEEMEHTQGTVGLYLYLLFILKCR